jgi:hypothetical protein
MEALLQIVCQNAMELTSGARLLCYYSHCLDIFNTAQEQRDVNLLNYLGFAVVNPNSPECQKAYETYGMEFFQALAQICQVTAFRAVPSWHIPAGVAAEIEAARAKGNVVIELPTGIARRKLNVDQTREYLAEAGQR